MPAYRIQRVAERDPFYFPIVLLILLVLAALFVVWRTAVVNWTVWYGPIAWVTEMFGLATTILFVFSMRKSHRAKPRAAIGPRKSVDIMIPTLNEPLAVVEATVLGATKVRGARKVFVLDDGNRIEICEMAQRLGASYITRSTQEGSKAGNLNNALKTNDAELVVVLDADHIPLPEFIEETVGYFDDPSVAWVQTAQSFYNTESFTFRRRHGDNAGWHEQEMFYGSVQPTKDSTNSAIFAGTSAMLRRAAIDSVGGFAIDTPTEDIHTSLRMHARGWQSVYLDKSLAYGLEVENLQEYFRTRRRWAVGSLMLLLRHRDSPMRIAGLTLWQRLSYLSAMAAHLHGLNRLLYLIAPIATLITGAPVVVGPYARYGIVFLAFTLLTMTSVHLFGRGHFHLIHSEVFAIADSVPMLSGLWSLFGRSRKFEVSQKLASRTSSKRVKIGYWIISAIGFFALGLAIFRLIRGEYMVMATWSAAFLAISAMYSLIFLVSTIRYERRQVSPKYSNLNPSELYQHVLSRSSTKAEPVPDRVFALAR